MPFDSIYRLVSNKEVLERASGQNAHDNGLKEDMQREWQADGPKVAGTSCTQVFVAKQTGYR